MSSVTTVAILGAGPLGGDIAFRLAQRNLVGDIRLIDGQAEIAVGKALDIQQAAAIGGFATRITGSGDLFETAAADVLVVADCADRIGPPDRADASAQGSSTSHASWTASRQVGVNPGPDEADRLGDADARPLRAWLQQATQLGRRTTDSGRKPPVTLCAGASHVELVDYGVNSLGLGHRLVLGSAAEALASGARALVALEAGCSPRDIGLGVIGRPPDRTVILWEEATIAGFSAVRALDEPTRRRLTTLIERLWPPGPLALAAAAVKALEAILGRSRELVTVFAAPQPEGGTRFRTVALPARLGPRGVESAELPELSGRASVALDSTRRM